MTPVAFSPLNAPLGCMESQREDVDGSASEVVAACEEAWRAFQRHHRGLPDVVVILGSGVERGRLVKLGHWWGGRWETAGELRGEVLLAGEALHLPVEDVFEVLLHEAAHGLNAARGVKDTSRAGRYHNANYRSTATEVGLVVAQMAPYGWADTKLGSDALQRYAPEIEGLHDAVRIARRMDAGTVTTGGVDPSTPGDSTGTVPGRAGGRSSSRALVCGCGRRMRMAPTVADQGPVMCGMCGTEFTTPGAESTPPTVLPSAAMVTHLRPVASPPEVVDGPAVAAAKAVLRDTVERDDGLVLVARAAAWEQRHGELLDEPLTVRDQADAAVTNRLARAFRRLHGHLSGPDVDTGGLLLAAGDQVVVSSVPGFSRVGAARLPDVGVLGQVIAVDPAGSSVAIDFPIAGRYRVSAVDAGRHLTYAYAMIGEPASLPLPVSRQVRLAPVIALSTATAETSMAEVIELGLP